jgi:hypothetical protein
MATAAKFKEKFLYLDKEIVRGKGVSCHMKLF